MLKTLILFCVSGAAALAQPIGGGLKFGVPVTDAFTVHSVNPLAYTANTHRYTLGPYIEFRLPAGFSIELDALYKSYEYQRYQALLVSSTQSASAWEFPLLAKKTLFPGPVKPYLEGGVALSHLSVADVIELNHRNNFGIVLGAGVEVHVGPLKISPEIRYQGWTLRSFSSPSGVLESNRSQGTILVGIGF